MTFTKQNEVTQNSEAIASKSNRWLQTCMGKIAVQIQEVKNTTPIILLHGVYFDHHLWDAQVAVLAKNQTIITLDMPLHGQSTEQVPKKWTLADCADMLKEVLDKLNISQVIAIGHSWGSMTILRAAYQYPERFLSVGFCNMPVLAATKARRRQFKFQHLLLGFRGFYTRQVAKAMFSKTSLMHNPQLLSYLQKTMGNLKNQAVKMTDRSVIMHADSGETMAKNLKIPALALKGKDDYVITPKGIELQEIPGRHVSPLEHPQLVLKFIEQCLLQQLQA